MVKAADPASDFFNDALKDPMPSVSKSRCTNAAVAAAPKAVPMSFEPAPEPKGPSSTVVRKAAPPAKQTLGTFAAATPKAKQAAKVIDFDFDFDEIETCANTPAPAPVAAVAKPSPCVDVPKQIAPMHQSGGYAAPGVSKAQAPQLDNFAGRKALSSDDFFNEHDSAPDREQRYNQFSNSGAISSDAFFGRDEKQPNQGNGFGGFFSNLASSAGDYLDNMKGQGPSGNPLGDAIGGYMTRRLNNSSR